MKYFNGLLGSTGANSKAKHVASDLSGIAGVASRYATALFELSLDNGELETANAGLSKLKLLIEESQELRSFIKSPLFTREDQSKVIKQIAAKSGLSKNVTNFLNLVASKNRLFALDSMISAWETMFAAHSGEVSAEIISATDLSEQQRDALETCLEEAIGSKVKIEESVDPTLLGGLIVKVGSKMIDSSLKTKLQRLQLVMKGAA